jgi:hypothetical protein
VVRSSDIVSEEHLLQVCGGRVDHVRIPVALAGVLSDVGKHPPRKDCEKSASLPLPHFSALFSLSLAHFPILEDSVVLLKYNICARGDDSCP